MSDHRQNGFIRISSQLGQQLMPEARLEDTTLQRELREIGFFDDLHKRLLLPESYEIVGVYYEHLRRSWDILLYSPEIEEPKEGLYIPRVEPIYRIDAQGKKTLARIQFEHQHQNERVLRVD